MRYRVDLTDEAWAKVRAQAMYIAKEAGAPLNAGRWLERVLDASETLDHSPRRCPLALENPFFPVELRALSVDGFLLLFTVDDDAGVVRILSARHGRQMPTSEDES